jgi:membrane protease YdiL (CAAX protease family)
MPAMSGLPTVADHLFAVVLVVGVPLYAAVFSWPRMKRRELADAAPDVRIRVYWGVMGPEWALALAVWTYGDRPWADFGFAAGSGWRLGGTLGAAAVIALAVLGQYAASVRTADGRARLRQEFRAVAPFAPQTAREMRHFALLAITAGICEEILYRGFLIWYAVQFTGVSVPGLALAVVASAFVFGAAHRYQGVKGAVRVGGLALVFGTLYVVCESLWPVILLHAYIDLAGGYLSLRVHRG